MTVVLLVASLARAALLILRVSFAIQAAGVVETVRRLGNENVIEVV